MKNRASALLIHSSWQERNLGVKLLGLLTAREKIPVLLVLFNERKPVSLIKRLLGGDFPQDPGQQVTAGEKEGRQ